MEYFRKSTNLAPILKLNEAFSWRCSAHRYITMSFRQLDIDLVTNAAMGFLMVRSGY